MRSRAESACTVSLTFEENPRLAFSYWTIKHDQCHFDSTGKENQARERQELEKTKIKDGEFEELIK